MELSLLALIAGFIVLYGALSSRLEKSWITAPMVFVAFGLLIGEIGLDVLDISLENERLSLLAEVTLVLVLFADSSHIDFQLLRGERDLAVRMLSLGLLLTAALGAGLAFILFPDFSIWQAAVLAAIITPTDAALAQRVISLPQIPRRVREALNIESGLNDGIALPLLILFLMLAGAETETNSALQVLQFSAGQLILGPLIGVAVGYIGGRLLEVCYERGWSKEPFLRLTALGLAILAYAVAELLSGNGFLAAFCAGITVGTTAPKVADRLANFADVEGHLLTMLTFIIFGAVMLPIGLQNLDAGTLLYALLSLFLVRMVAIAISLLGERMHWQTIGFLGWFGPHGVASIIYLLIVINLANMPGAQQLLQVSVIVIGLSVLLHGLSAAPLANWYKRQVDDLPDDAPEKQPISQASER